MDLGMVICGSAKTVREQLNHYAKELGFGNLLVMCQFGTLPGDLTKRNMERFAESVIPAVRKASRELYGEEVAIA